MIRTLEQNLDVLRVIGREDIAAHIEQMAPANRSLAAAAAVSEFAPVRDAILSASHEQLPSVLDSLLAAEVSR